jgi:hypothetical protein
MAHTISQLTIIPIVLPRPMNNGEQASQDRGSQSGPGASAHHPNAATKNGMAKARQNHLRMVVSRQPKAQ